jgi:hypothetical protein
MPSPVPPAEVLASLYHAALAPEEWSAAMESVSAWVGGGAAVLQLRRMDGWPRGTLVSHGFDLSYVPVYEDNYVATDPHLVHLPHMPLAKPLLSEQVIPPKELVKTAFFRAILAPHGLHDSQGVLVFRNARWAAVFAAFATRRGVLGAESGARMESMVPHLERTLALGADPGSQRGAATAWEPIKGLLGAATLHVSRTLEVLDHWEPSWGALFERADAPLLLRGATLRARHRADDERLRHAVRLGTEGHASMLPLGVGALRLSLAVAPGPRVSPFSALRSARLLVSRAAFGPAPPGNAFRALPAGLLAVAERMARGQSDKQIAAELEIGHATARTYATRVLRRLGLNSRRELMQIANVLDRGTR